MGSSPVGGWMEAAKDVKRAAIAAGAALAVAALVAGATGSCSAPDAGMLQLDTGNARQMHDYGLPTKADVLEWHMGGQWGWAEGSGADARYVILDELPGGQAAWDALYGIDPANPAFER